MSINTPKMYVYKKIMLADFHHGDVNTALDVLQSFNNAIQADSTHQTPLNSREIMNIVATQANTTGSITESANIQNMLVENVDDYNKDTDELIAMNIQTDINTFTNANMERDLSRALKLKQTIRKNVVKDRQHYLSNRYATEQNQYTIFAIQLAFWMESLIFLIMAVSGQGYMNTLVMLSSISCIVVGYVVLMCSIIRQNSDRRTDVFNRFYWSSTAVKK